MRKLFLLVFLFVLASLLTLYFVSPKVTDFKFPENVVWKHRQNKPDATLRALSEGHQGVELDIMFYDGVLRVSHDAGELSQSVTLATYITRLEEAGVKPHLWLDIKTMTREFEPAIRVELLALVERFDLAERLIVESPRPTKMFRLCQVPLKCSVWLRRTGNPLARFQSRLVVNALSHWGRLVMVSIEHGKAGNADAIVPRKFPKAYYTYPDKTQAVNAAQKGGAVLYLTD